MPSERRFWNAVVFHSLTLQGIYGREMFETWYKMTSLIQSGVDISTCHHHHFPFQQFKEAIELASPATLERSCGFCYVVILSEIEGSLTMSQSEIEIPRLRFAALGRQRRESELPQLRRPFFVALKLEHHAADMLVILMPLQKAQAFL